MKPRRLQPPVGYRLRPLELLRAAAGARGSRARLEQQVAAHFGVSRVFGVSSGKAALTTILQSLHALTGRSKVIIPAYTCYSVPSAIVRAGLVPVPCDIARGTFDYDYDRLQALVGPDVLCALSVHLFGIAADTRRLQRLGEPHGIFVVEDAAQAMGVVAHGRPLGTRGDVGFFSLGRGKNITCGAGGLILTSDPAIARDIAARVEALPDPGAAGGVRKLAELAAMSLLISPRLYWLPAGIPALKLGETIYDTSFPLQRLTDMQAAVLVNWRERLAALNAIRLSAAAHYQRTIAAAVGCETHVPYLRFPLVVGNRQTRDRIVREGRDVGVGGMYPDSVGAIPELSAVLRERSFPEAERVAASLVSLPTHALLTEQDRVRVCEVLNRALGDRRSDRVAPDRASA